MWIDSRHRVPAPIVALTVFTTTALMGAEEATAQLADPSQGVFINEIYFDPPGGDEVAQNEFIELRGTPGSPLTDLFLVILESEDGGPGGVDNIFDLGSFSFGSNGFLSLRQKQTQVLVANNDANNLVNAGPNLPPFFTASPGFGSGPGSASVSTIGASDDGDDGTIENGGFSALLLRNDTGLPITLNDDFDGDDDGELDQFVFDNYTILDSVGQSEPDETDIKFYAAINFTSNGNTGATVTPGGQIVSLPFEIEYLGRWGNSTGQTADDWLVANVTSDSNSGSGALPGVDFRVSTLDPQPAAGSDTNSDGIVDTPPGPLAPGGIQPGDVEASQDVPFGLPILNTLGGPNFLNGDFDRSGEVSAADYAVFRDTIGQTADEANPAAADHDRSFIVDTGDYELFTRYFGSPAVGGSPAVAASPLPSPIGVPEPQSALLLLAMASGWAASGRPRPSR